MKTKTSIPAQAEEMQKAFEVSEALLQRLLHRHIEFTQSADDLLNEYDLQRRFEELFAKDRSADETPSSFQTVGRYLNQTCFRRDTDPRLGFVWVSVKLRPLRQTPLIMDTFA